MSLESLLGSVEWVVIVAELSFGLLDIQAPELKVLFSLLSPRLLSIFYKAKYLFSYESVRRVARVEVLAARKSASLFFESVSKDYMVPLN